MNIAQFLDEGYNNKYILYLILSKYKSGKYKKMSEFCDDFIISFKEIDKKEFTQKEKNIFDEIDTNLSLYTPFESDLKLSNIFKSEEEIIKILHPLLFDLGINI